jgi:hypothetical protein
MGTGPTVHSTSTCGAPSHTLRYCDTHAIAEPDLTNAPHAAVRHTDAEFRRCANAAS